MKPKSKIENVEKPTSILDQRFKYTDSASTDLAKKFKAIKRELKQKAEDEAAKSQQPDKVRQFRRMG
jgi:hypothetical protein